MKSKIKNQWTQIVSVMAAAACAVTATVAGVSSSFSTIDAYALEAGDKITLTAKEDSGGAYYALDLSGTTMDDVGKTVYLDFVASKYANQGLVGGFGYTDPTSTTYWSQKEWEVQADSTGKFTVELEIETVMVGNSAIKVMCWYPTVADIDSYSAVFGKTEDQVTTTTTETPITTTVSSETSDSDSEEITTTTTSVTSTTTTVTTAPEQGTEIKFTEGTQKGNDGDIQAVAEFKPDDAKYAVIKYKVLSDDLKSSGGVGTWNGEWEQVDFDEDVDADGMVTITYQIPSNVGETVKAMVFYPSNDKVKFQSITLFYGDKPSTTAPTGSTTTVTTVKPSDLTFTTVKIGADNKTNMLHKCYLVATIKAPAGSIISGGMYYDTVKAEWKNEKVDSTGLMVKEYAIRGQSDCNFQIHWYTGPNGGTTSISSVPVSIQTYYEGDASLNGKVDGSDVRAIANYLKGKVEKTDLRKAVCDYDGNGSVTMADAVALTKALIGSGTVAGN